MASFFHELKRRNVYRVAVAYAVVAWLLIQIATATFPVLEIPVWATRLVIALVVLGFPLALIFAWAFELTPEGIKRTEDVAPNESITRRTGRKLMAGVAVVAAIAFALLLVRILPPKPDTRQTKPRAGAASRGEITEKGIAVLPFENLSDDKQNAYFADGVHEEILTTLAKVADLKVISRTSVMQFRDPEKRNLRDIAQQLGVAHVLEGSVQRAANRVRVTAQLVDARTDAHVWAERYDGDLADVFAIQTEIAQKIAGQLKAALSPKEQAAIQSQPTADTAAYDLYLRARELMSSSGANYDSTIGPAIMLLDQAVARDPSFVAAFCLLARAHLRAYWFNFDHTPARVELARKALDAAARLQPDAGEVHLARGLFYYWGSRDYAPALAELAVASRSLPNSADVFYYEGLISRRGARWEESIRAMERAIVLDPRNIAMARELALGYGALRRYDEARRVLDNLLVWTPDNVPAQVQRAALDFSEKADLEKWRRVVAGVPSTAVPDPVAASRRYLALLRRDYSAAEEVHAKHRMPETALGFITPPEYFEGRIARGLGDAQRSEAAFLRAREQAAAEVAARSDDAKALIVLADIDANLGRREDAVRAGQRAVEMLPVSKDAVDGPLMLVRLGKIYAAVGETNLALDALERAAAVPNGPSYGELQLEDSFDPLRGDARFQKIVASLAPKDSK
jgi:TolB-like protein/Tfp pilus assembly protein PilF